MSTARAASSRSDRAPTPSVAAQQRQSGRSRSTGTTNQPSRHRQPALAVAGPDKAGRPRSRTSLEVLTTRTSSDKRRPRPRSAGHRPGIASVLGRASNADVGHGRLAIALVRDVAAGTANAIVRGYRTSAQASHPNRATRRTQRAARRAEPVKISRLATSLDRSQSAAALSSHHGLTCCCGGCRRRACSTIGNVADCGWSCAARRSDRRSRTRVQHADQLHHSALHRFGTRPCWGDSCTHDDHE